MESHRFYEAADDLTRAVRVTPDDVKLLVMRATAFRLTRRFKEALGDLDAAAKGCFVARHSYREPEPTAFLTGDAQAIARKREYAVRQAMGGVHVSRREPFQVTRQRTLVYNDIALDLMNGPERGGQHARAVTFLNKAVVLERQLATGDLLAGAGGVQLTSAGATSSAAAITAASFDASNHLLSPASKHPQAARMARDATAKESRRLLTRLLINRGDCYRALNKVEQALADFHGALEEDPENWDTKTRLSLIHYMIAVDLLNKCRYEEAELEISVALGFNDKVSAYFAVRGRTLYHQHKFGDSYVDFRKALALDPSNDAARKALLQFEPHQATLKEATLGIAGFDGAAGEIKKLPPIDTPLKQVNPFLAKAEPARRQAKEANEDLHFLFEQPGSGMPLEKEKMFADMLKRSKEMTKSYEKKNKETNEFGTIWDSTADCLRIEREKKEEARKSRRRANSRAALAVVARRPGKEAAATMKKTKRKNALLSVPTASSSFSSSSSSSMHASFGKTSVNKTDVNADVVRFFADVDANFNHGGWGSLR